MWLPDFLPRLAVRGLLKTQIEKPAVDRIVTVATLFGEVLAIAMRAKPAEATPRKQAHCSLDRSAALAIEVR